MDYQCGRFTGSYDCCFGDCFYNRIIKGLGASEMLFPYCREYLFILLLFTPASMLQVLFQNLIVTAGRPGIGMALGVSAGAVNILFDYIFMVPLQMGIRGAALGTGMGYLIPTAAGILFFAAGNGILHFRKPVMDVSVLTESCTNGFSEMVSQSAAAVTMFLFNRIMMRLLGEDGVAVITIIIYTQFLLSALYIGFSMCVRFLILVSIFIFGTAYVFGAPMVSFFSKEGTPIYEIARKGVPYHDCGGGFPLPE